MSILEHQHAYAIFEAERNLLPMSHGWINKTNKTVILLALFFCSNPQLAICAKAAGVAATHNNETTQVQREPIRSVAASGSNVSVANAALKTAQAEVSSYFNIISILSAFVTVLAVVVGPLVTIRVARKQNITALRIAKSQASTNIAIATSQITAPIKQRWSENLREFLAEFLRLTSELRRKKELKMLTIEQTNDLATQVEKYYHLIRLMVDMKNSKHSELVAILSKYLQSVESIRPGYRDASADTLYDQITKVAQAVLTYE